MAITPTVEQDSALLTINTWLKTRSKPFFYLTGSAGTGKTSLASHIAEGHSGPVVALAYTGKAAHVLTRKGLPAQTIHSKIYLPSNERNAEADALRLDLEAATDIAKIRRLRKRLEDLNSPNFVLRALSPFSPDTLIILDEVSMVSKTEAEDLLSFGHPILVLGDDNQLPPIEGRGYFNGKPDFRLETIHRQAAESPVIHLAMQVLAGKPLAPGAYGGSLVTSRAKITPELALSCSQIICGSNKARKELNADIRRFQNFTADLPQKGERLICLRNNPRDALLNGQMVDLAADVCPVTEDDRFVSVKTTDGQQILAHEACFSDPDSLKSWPYSRRKFANEFDYGWCITGYKSQGSQWPRVLVWDEMFKWDKELHKKHLYTCLTRAEESAVIAL